MDTKGPISPSSDGNSYVYIIVDAFTHYVVLHSSPKNDATHALTVLFDHWIFKFGIPDNLVTDNGNEYINGEITHLCRTYNLQFKPRTPYAPWSNGLVENSNRLLNTFLRTVLDKRTASSCSLGQLENEYVQEGRDKDLPLECHHFPINPRFTERFWHLSKNFFALADRPNFYFNTFFSRDTVPYKIYAKYDPFFLQFGFLHPTQMDVNDTIHKVNRVKMLHTMHNFLFVQHHFQHTNPLIHMNSRLQYAKTNLTSPYDMNYSYVIKPNFCQGALRNFDPIKIFHFLPPLLQGESPHPRPNRISSICGRRSHKVHLRTHI